MTTKVKAGVLDISGDVASSLLVAGTVQATTSGTAFDFSIPSWAKRISMLLSGVSLSGTDALLFQLGDAGGIEPSGYSTNDSIFISASSPTVTNRTDGWRVPINAANYVISGRIVFELLDASTFTWVGAGQFRGLTAATTAYATVGDKSLSAALTQVRLTRSGTDTFDAGKVNILYE